MTHYIALLRGVNVGKAKRVPMAELRALLAGLGYTGVTTLLNSGNAVFHATGGAPAANAQAIRAALAARLHLDVPVIVLTAQTLAAIVAEYSLAHTVQDPARLLVAFVQDPAALADLATVAALIVPPEHFQLGAAAAYLHCPNGLLDSAAATALLGKAGKATTTRNWATVLKLLARVQG